MITKQLSVFLENKEGRLGEVLRVLKDNAINIQSLSLADTAEYGLLRLIVDKPEEGKEKLFNAGFSAMLADVLIVKVEHQPGGLQNLLELISNKGINVEYMYALSIAGEEATIVLKPSDLKKACEAFGILA